MKIWKHENITTSTIKFWTLLDQSWPQSTALNVGLSQQGWGSAPSPQDKTPGGAGHSPGAASPASSSQEIPVLGLSGSTIHQSHLEAAEEQEMRWSCSLGSQAQQKSLGLSPFPALLRGEAQLRGFLCFKLGGRTEIQRGLSLSKRKFKVKDFHCSETPIKHKPQTWG